MAVKPHNQNEIAKQAHTTTYSQRESLQEAQEMKLLLEGQISQQQGQWVFPALFLTSGPRERAVLILGEWGWCWSICDIDGAFQGKFVGAFPLRRSTMERKGYVEATEWAPAKVVTKTVPEDLPTGHHPLGYMVHVERTDGGYLGRPVNEPSPKS